MSTIDKMPVNMLDAAGAPDGYSPIVSGGKFILDDPGGGVGLPWFVASAYGAVEGGSASANRTALNSLIADLNTAGKGVFYVDGRYDVDAGLTAITAHANIFGDGAGDLQAQNAASALKLNATTGNLLTLAGDGTCVENIGFENPTSTAQTAGAAIRVTQGDLNRYRNVSVRGFYDNINIEDGALWTMHDCYLVGARRYGLYIRHIDLPDGGDMVVDGCSIYAEDRNASAAVRLESGGGLKFANNKINTLFGTATFTYGLDATLTASTGVLTVTGNSFENVTNSGVRGQNSGGTFQAVAITGNQFGYYTPSSGPPVDINGWRDVTVVGNTMIYTYLVPTSFPAVKFTNVTHGAIGLNTLEGFPAEYALTSCTGITTVAGGVPTSRQVASGTGLTGGGDLTADRTLAIDTTAEAERIRDVTGAALVQGSGITITVDDAGDTITIAAASGSGGLVPVTTLDDSGNLTFLIHEDGSLIMAED
jgi:hypothetical protein